MVCFYVMSRCIHPYGVKRSELSYNIRHGKKDISAEKNRVAQDLLEGMLADDPDARPSAEQVLR